MPEVQDNRNRPTRLINRRDVDIRNRGLSLITKILPGVHFEIESSTGVDEGTGDVKLRLRRTGVKAGRYNVLDVDEFGRIVRGSWVAPTGGSGSVDYTTVIRNQFSQAQNASLWISGSARVDGITVLETLNLNNPLLPESGGTGTASASAGQVFAGPASGSGVPSFRLLQVSDLPNGIPANKLQLPLATNSTAGMVRPGSGLSVDGSGILAVTGTYTLPPATTTVLGGVIVGAGLTVDAFGVLTAPVPDLSGYLTVATSQSVSGVKSFSAAPVMSAGVEFASAAPVSTVNKLYQVTGTLYWNGVEVGSNYTLPTASATVLGGIKVGANLSIDGNGVLSASTGYTLPVATASILGGVKQGAGVSIAGDGALNVSALTRRQTFTVGNGTDLTFNLVHSFSTTGISVSIRKTTGTRSQVVFDNYLTPGNESNAVTVVFPTAPSASEYEVTIIADNAVLESLSELSSLADVSLSGLTTGQFLSYNGTSWTNTTLSVANMVTTDTTQTITGLKKFDAGLRLARIGDESNFEALTNVGGALYWNGVALGSGTLTGSGTTGQLTRWSGSGALTSDAGMVTIQTGGITRVMTLGDGAVANPVALRLNSAAAWSNYVIHQINSLDVWAFGVTTAGSRHFRIANNAGAAVIDFPLIIEDASAGPITFGGSTLRPISVTGVLNVAALLTASQSLELPSYTPGATTNKLYNNAGTLYWNGTPVGSGGSSAFAPSSVRSVTFNASANADAAYINAYSRLTPDATTRVLTIPQTLGAVNDEITIEQVGSNMLTVTAGASVSFRPPGITSFRPRVDGSTVTLKCVFKDGSTSTWTVIGDYV